MTRRILALTLTAILSGSCFGQAQPSGSPSPKEQVRTITANSRVEVKFIDDSKQRGRIGEVSDTGFVLTHEKNKQMDKVQVAFVQVKAVKQVSERESHKHRNILIGVGIGVGVVVALGVAYAMALGKLGHST
jgi:hypothetical protein